MSGASTALHQGYDALARGVWEEARACFEAAVQQHATPGALEGLATAADWLDDIATATEVRQRAYERYRER